MTPEHSRNPARSSSLGGSVGQGLSSSLPLSAPITGEVGDWLIKSRRDLRIRNAVKACREGTKMPGYTPSSKPIAEIPPKPAKAYWFDRPSAFMAVCAVISLIGLAIIAWSA
ncbi:hypothetical protein [Pseudooceanicola atlanticus]|uniref:Uncharacterized protein n=1 Tax=Pseudooceanicola atlanticus TaxID=1461694 RepID=A0A0A0EN52_9RHOB|nr:hypothetical protein [Pseudooceanicola atlanticus]KGM50642.1 hypothetical protein ATO9_03960 [Pseudooceanicola atlanticus]